jgi:hypothetical protein
MKKFLGKYGILKIKFTLSSSKKIIEKNLKERKRDQKDQGKN